MFNVCVCVCVKFFRLDTLEKSCYEKRNKFRGRINLIECLIIIHLYIERLDVQRKIHIQRLMHARLKR